jgi:hypothetical protein
VLNQITTTFQLRHDSEHGDQYAEAPCRRARHRDQLVMDQFLHGELKGVNGLIGSHDDSGRLTIVVEKCRRRGSQTFAHHGEQAQHLLVDVRQ